MTIELDRYYDRFDPAKGYERHLFRSGSPLQSAELNELQSAFDYRLTGVADVLFNDGAVLSGGDCITAVTGETCSCHCLGGAIYIRGAARGVLERTFSFAATGRFDVGVYLHEQVVTELDDPGLRDPAVSPLNNQEPGAARLESMLTWGYRGEFATGAFYAVYVVEDGVLIGRTPPPDVDAINQAISRYDRQSAGGYYVSSGFKVSRLADSGTNQVYSMSEGVARVGGNEIIRNFATRFTLPNVPDLRSVSLEAHPIPDTAVLGEDHALTLNYAPVWVITGCSVVRRVTHNWVRGPVAGTADLLPLVPVITLLSVTQGATTYVATTDFVLDDDEIDWSPGGAEPSPGSTYAVTYEYTDTLAQGDLLAITETGFTVPGTVSVEGQVAVYVDAELVPDTPCYTFYSWALPRIDRVCMTNTGAIVVVLGIARRQRPYAPKAPSGMLGIGVLNQWWGASSSVANNGVRLVPMDELFRINRRIETLFALVAEERLALNLTQRDATAKKGVFTDPFLDDDMRDQGIEQDAPIFRGLLTLGISTVVHSVSLADNATLDARVLVDETVTVGPDELYLDQSLRTSVMRVNPYDSFAPLPGVARLSPATDYWTDFDTNWLSPITRQFDETIWLDPITSMNQAHIDVISVTTETESDVELVGIRYIDLAELRQIEVLFRLEGFGSGELLNAVRFDGVSVPFTEQ